MNDNLMKKPYVLNEVYFSLAKKPKKKTSYELNEKRLGDLFPLNTKESFAINTIDCEKKLKSKIFTSPKVHKTSKSNIFFDKSDNGYLVQTKRTNVHQDKNSALSSFRENQSSSPNCFKGKLAVRKTLSRKNSLEDETNFQHQSEWTIYTQENNNVFKKNVKKLNKIETLFLKEVSIYNIKKEIIDHEQNKNHGFITEANDSFRDPIIKSNVLSSLVQTITIKKFTCEYIAIPIKNQETPLKVTFSTIGESENSEKKLKFKIFGSTKSKFPNKFNAEFVYEV